MKSGEEKDHENASSNSVKIFQLFDFQNIEN
jgi:hypothetical protein